MAACQGTPPEIVPYEANPIPDDAPAGEPSVTEAQVRLEPELLEVPSKLELGDTLRYVVELRNDTDDPISLDPCPAYYQAWGESSVGVSRTSRLNCAEGPDTIGPGESQKFAMELPLVDTEPTEGAIVWYLGAPDAARRADVTISGEVEVVAPSE